MISKTVEETKQMALVSKLEACVGQITAGLQRNSFINIVDERVEKLKATAWITRRVYLNVFDRQSGEETSIIDRRAICHWKELGTSS